MNDQIHIATAELAWFLAESLPKLSPDWWKSRVVDRLSFQQQRAVQERGYSNLRQLDFAALLRVFDQNWFELSNALNLAREGRSWLKEMQTVRNRWAHLSAEAISASETYRDADTLGRLLKLIGARAAAIQAVETLRAKALADMTPVVASTPKLPSAVTEADGVKPTKRSGFQVGDLVALRSDAGTVFPVIEVLDGSGESRYRVFHNNTKATYYQSQLQAAAAPDVKTGLSAEQLRARLTAAHVLSPSTTNILSLHSGRVQFVPYQYRPVLKLIRSDRPRLLIADEVGVGKTIEAGLIIKELRARMNLSSVLIICPKALVAERKWYLEMRRFDEQFTALDGRLLRHCVKETDLEGEWPEQYSNAILPFSLFDSDLVVGSSPGKGKSGKALLELDPAPRFGLVIVDEAHHLRNPDTFLHQGVRLFCDNADAVVFLSATPVQLGSNDLFTLLNVLRPDLVIDAPSFELMAAPNRHINQAIAACRASKAGWEQEAQRALEEAGQTDWGRLFLRESPAFQSVYDRVQGAALSDAERIALIRELEEVYTFSGLINRTRRRDIGEFTTRKPETLSIRFTTAQQDLHDSLLDVIARILAICHGQQSVKFMMTTVRRQAASCLYGLAPFLDDVLSGNLDRLEALESTDSDAPIDLSFVDAIRGDVARLSDKVRNLERHDPKVDALVGVLIEKGRLSNNKALVFSTFRHTLAYLDDHLARTNVRYAVIHGSVADDERAELRKRFSLPKDDPKALDVLLSSEVGCEGLDFQFCDFLVNYDLPWNPMRIEQRIGRIDRYGQKSPTVRIINFVTPGTVDAEIYERCLWRIGVFQHAIGGNEEILGSITEELQDLAESFELTQEEREARLRQVADNGIRLIREEQELESKQAELFGLNIPNQAWQREIESASSQWLTPGALQRCVSYYLTQRTGADSDQLLGDGPVKTLRLNQDARSALLQDFRALRWGADAVSREWEKWLKGSQALLSVTFDQASAADNAKVIHLSAMHPLVRQAAKHLRLEEAAYAYLTSQTSDVPPGSYPFALYRWSMHGVKTDEALVSVAANAAIEDAVLGSLIGATDWDTDSQPPSEVFEALDARHHQKWANAQADHVSETRQFVEHRKQSLNVSYQSRRRSIENQIARASNSKIAVMKRGELARAEADFARALTELERQGASGDIHATPILFGVLNVAPQSNR